MAKVLEVSESGYYKWVKRQPSKREQEDLKLIHEIKRLYDQFRGIYGARKITFELNRQRERRVNHKRVERLMSEYQLFSKVKKVYKKTTCSDHGQKIADDLIKRDFEAKAPNEKMLSDTTAVRTRQGWLYVAGILDLFGRIPVGLATSTKNNKELTLAALKDLHGRGHGAPGCILHSDQGSTYCSGEYRTQLSKYDLLCSMSRKGDCWDNAPMESFWGKLKTEWLEEIYDTIEEARSAVYEYVWSFYIHIRIHAANGYLTPAQFYAQGSTG
jgi:putative transposase